MFIYLSAYVAFVLIMAKGLSFPLVDVLQPLLTSALLLVVAVVRPHFAPRLKGLAFLVTYSAVYAVLMDAAAAGHTTLYDSYLVAVDAWLGCDVSSMEKGGLLLQLAYFSFLPQLALAVWFLSDTPFLRRFATVATVAVICLILFPCRGNYTGDHGLTGIAAHFDQLATATTVTWCTSEGIITMPSVHTAVAILLIAGFWKTRLALPILILNALMILSTLPVGRHYVVDLLAGGTLALLTIITIPALDKPESLSYTILCSDFLH